jgi:hypothetical protein
MSRDLASQFPDRSKILDTNRPTTEGGVRELLTHCGYSRTQQEIILAKPPAMELVGDPGPPPHPYGPQDPRRCVVLFLNRWFDRLRMDIGIWPKITHSVKEPEIAPSLFLRIRAFDCGMSEIIVMAGKKRDSSREDSIASR